MSNLTNKKMSDSDLEVYIFQGNKGEKVPASVEKLILDQGIQILPADLCYYRQSLREVNLHEGLTGIENRVFQFCRNLLDIKIGSMVQYIGGEAFDSCGRMTKVEFENSTSSPHQLRTISRRAFCLCKSLPIIKLPSSVTSVGQSAFGGCFALKEANLSTTGITKISEEAFANCRLLQTVNLPSTLERIGDRAFSWCRELVTVVVPLDDSSQPIKIGYQSFYDCKQLANLVLSKDSTAEEKSFTGCDLLHERYGEDCFGIVAGLIGRFEHFSMHRICYDHSGTMIQELQECIAKQQERDFLLDTFGMTPFHVFFSTAEPSGELLDVMLDSLPNHILLKLKDCNGRRPLEYLINNWSDGTISLLRRTLEKWMIDRVARWGAASRTEAMKGKVQEILAEDDKNSRATLYNKAYAALEQYETIEATSILEMALWKWKLKSGWSSDGTRRQALDRDKCRYLSGSNVVIPRVTVFFLDIPGAPSQDD